MDVATVSTGTGLLRVELEDRGGSWVARLVDAGPRFSSLPAAVGPHRTSALSSLQAAVRALDDAAAPPLARPGSWDLCP